MSSDAVWFHIDPSRSAEAARKLFAGVSGPVFLVCDRFSAYKKLARDLAGLVVLCWCWAHIRRDYIKCAAGRDTLAPWRDQWLQRIGGIYQLNKARLEHYTPGAPVRSAAFETAHSALNDALDALFAQAERERAALAHDARQLQALRSMLEHREGLTRFVEHPQIAMDNNTAEGSHRSAVIGRKLSFGSDSLDGARLTALMYSVLGTVRKNGLDVQRWLTRLAHRLRRTWPLTARRAATLAAMDDERAHKARLHHHALSGAVECRYYGRDFTAEEMALLRTLIATDPPPTRAALSREFCRRTGWLKPDGGLKDMMARVTMLAMHRDKRIALPAPKGKQGPAQADPLRA